MQDAQRFIESLRKTGCPVCLDDFGTGFSSFAYLKHLNADVLKIDGLFIRDLPNDRDNQIFVKAIVDVARGMHKTTVAEFVESQEILEMLIAFGVDLVQGYLASARRSSGAGVKTNSHRQPAGPFPQLYRGAAFGYALRSKAPGAAVLALPSTR
jgi:EAL domain-containing protein (putative c-di-GMP-specific phosphodiesterase class I)